MFSDAIMNQQLINEKRDTLIAEADRYRLLATAREALRARRARSRRNSDLS